jgi:O-antigen biosynthesis protein WbqP
MKRIFDLTLSFFSLLFLLPLIIFIAVVVKLTSKGPIIYWSDRVGKNNVIFRMAKFRTMNIGAPVVATHLLYDSGRHLTPVGSILRRLSLDELPQLWNIFIGDMSFVGPRPALFNQSDLIELRTSNGVDGLIPGLTGWAQVNGRDELSVVDKVKYDMFYLRHQSFSLDILILKLTLLAVIEGRSISH